jgi:FtsZ-binding cell division protein ZapB
MTDVFFELTEDSAPVDPKSLETLELKISQVLERVQMLQSEKQELQKQVADLHSRYDEAAQRVAELTRECEVLRRNQRDVKQDELIRSKITALLAKLDGA